jgi:carbon starvation protein
MAVNVAVLFLIALPIFWLAYRYYSRYIGKQFDENPANPTPAVTMQDDVDFVPTRKQVLFGHHFAAIAGGGPIIGPTCAMAFGYIPVFLWIVFGTVFIGAVHDFSALFVSLREKGKSMAEVANSSLGRAGFFLFISFTIVMLLLVTSAFLGLTSVALTSLRPLKDLGLPENQTIVKTVLVNGVKMGKIGGIASMSVVVITCCAPIIGYLIYRRNVSTLIANLLAISACALSIVVGFIHPIAFKSETWMIMLSIYTIFAAGIPVWMVLQPRDYTNSFVLYAGVIALSVGLIAGGLTGIKLNAPAFNVAYGVKNIGLIWPFLFITVACGAISGFHALVAGGTTCKQLSTEADARPIAFGAMILEGILALAVLLAVAGGIHFKDYCDIVFPTAAGAKSNPILAFSVGMAGLLHKSIGFSPIYGTVFGILLVEGFVVTTLDTAVRLNRYLFEELWSFIFKKVPKLLKSYLFNAGLAVIAMYLLARYNAFLVIWPIFATANQLLAAMTLIVVSVWLARRGKSFWFTALPTAFMMATTLASLIWLLFKNYLPAHNIPLIIADILLLVLSVGVFAMVIKSIASIKGNRASAKA